MNALQNYLSFYTECVSQFYENPKKVIAVSIDFIGLCLFTSAKFE
jgi:hypothetical protein